MRGFLPNGCLVRFIFAQTRLKVLLLAALAGLLGASPAVGQTKSLEDLVSSVVRLKTSINPNGRTVDGLGHARDGSGIVIDDNGLILTIGYLMVEANTAEVITNDGRTVPATVVGYDHETGFGLVRALQPLKIKPIAFGKSGDLKERDPVIAASHGGVRGVAPAYVVARRQFAGNWEYLVDGAIFTAPAHSDWSGAALINREGKLVGVGSLIVGDATGKGDSVAGNMYVPTDLLMPILADLIANGRIAGAGHPWLGLTTNEVHGRLFVARVTPGSPAEKAGIARGDIIVGVNGQAPSGMADFYRKLWAQGGAGVTVPIDVLQGTETKRLEIQTINRLDHLRLKTTF